MKKRTNAIVVEISRSPVPLRCGSSAFNCGTVSESDFVRRVGMCPRRSTSSFKYFISWAVFRRADELEFLDVRVGNRQVKAIAERAHRFDFHLLGLVRDVLRFARLAHAVALDRLGEDDRGLPFVIESRFICRVHFARIVAAALQRPNVFVAHVGDKFGRFRIASEEIVAHEFAVARLERLIIAVDAFIHHLNEPSGGIAFEQRVPARNPK